jgi:TonB-dependent receptor
LLPLWQSNTFIDRRRPVTPSLWQEDRYYHESTKFSGTQGMTEVAQAAYLMAHGRLGRGGVLGRTGYLGGVRLEDTAVDSWGRVRARTLSTPAQQLADPVGAALRDFGNNYREDRGAYRKPFPSIHAFHDLTPNLKFRAAFSTSFGRAGFDTFVPAETPNETASTVAVSNPGIRPQTAKNWDVGCEYYFEPVGQVSISWFHKEIRDYIIANQEVRVIPSGADNGYNGEYAGWSERSTINSGTAVAQGWEFSYQQQFTFLPGALKGLSALFNYTWIDTHGLFNGTTYLTRREVQTFIPHTANAQLSWNYRRFSTRLLYNFTGEHLNVFNATPALRLYRRGFKNLNAGIAYQVRPSLSLTLDAANVLNEPQVVYRGSKDRTQRTILNFVTLTAGINGRF